MQIASLESQSNDRYMDWCRWLQKCFENRRNNWGPWPPPLNPLLGLLQLGAVQSSPTEGIGKKLKNVV